MHAGRMMTFSAYLRQQGGNGPIDRQQLFKLAVDNYWQNPGGNAGQPAGP
jgi:hypothetical protein